MFMGIARIFGNDGAAAKKEAIKKQRHLRDTGGTDTEHIRIPHDINSLFPNNSIYTLSLPALNTEDGFFSLSKLAGRVAIVINVACAWGKTALTYEQIQLLLRADAGVHGQEIDDVEGSLKDMDLNTDDIIILAFPTNDFRQEPGSNEEISRTVLDLLGHDIYHNPNFVLFPKSSLKTNPVYRLLKRHMPQAKVKHNFYKFIVGRDGLPFQFYEKKDDLLEIVTELKEGMTGHGNT